MPSYELYYFNARGLGETCRLLFAEAGVKYEDKRFTQETWPEQKPKMLFGQMPVLMVDGEQIAHSRAAVRYLAREFKLDGGSALNAAKTDMWIEVLMETLTKLPFEEKDEAKKAEKMKEVMKDQVIPKLVKLQENMKGIYLFGEKPSGADFFVYNLLDLLRRRATEQFLEPVPKLKAMMAAFEARPKIKTWLKERPETEN